MMIDRKKEVVLTPAKPADRGRSSNGDEHGQQVTQPGARLPIPGGIDKAEDVRIMSEALLELHRCAQKHELKFLAYLIEMAAHEASKLAASHTLDEE